MYGLIHERKKRKVKPPKPKKEEEEVGIWGSVHLRED